MNATTKFKTSFMFDDMISKNKKHLSKSSSMVVNNYSLYEKYIKKTPINRNKSRNNENSIKSISVSSKKIGNYQSSFNISCYDNNESRNTNSIFSPFSKIMENYIQQKQKEMSLRKQNVQSRNNFSRNNKKFVFEINSNNSNSNSYNKKTYAGINLITQHLNQLSKKKSEFINNNNKLKSSRNRNLSMKDIDNISYMINLKYTNNNIKNNKTQKDNIFEKKFYNKKIQTSPSYNLNVKKTNVKNRKDDKSNIVKNNNNNPNKLDNELDKKYNILFNSNSNYSSENNKISTSSRTNSIKGPNYNSYRSVESEYTKQNSLNIKKEKKDDNLEGPELIHFSLVELIQKGRKKMEQIAENIKSNKKKK